ncbi:hypothetical protein AAC387_Pa03g0740 [Persea americana]
MPIEYMFYIILFIISLTAILLTKFDHNGPKQALPPGSFGWPIIGEFIDLQRTNRSGKPDKFITERMERYNKHIFKTSLFGEKTAVLCGPAANKLLFTSEKKLVQTFWPPSLKKLFGTSFFTAPYNEAIRTRKLVTLFLKPEVLSDFVGRFDSVCKKSIREDWAGKEQVMSYSLIKKYAFAIACEVFASINDPGCQERLLEEFNLVLGGVFQLPIYLPGTRHYKAVNAARVIRRELLDVIERKRRRREMMGGCKEEEVEDLISHLMDVRGEGGKGLTDEEIADNILLLMDSGHDTSSSTMMMLVKYLAELPECYERVLAEQKEIALSKAPGELLKKDDIQKMKYSWNVVNEVLRLSPPIQATFRRAIVDFSYAGFSIPKGWSVWWTVNSTHKSEEYFPEPEKFNPSRFEGDIPAPYTYVPFGGGPRMCPGREFARIEILVFLHNLVREFRWDLVFPNELITVEPMPLPSKGLPVYLHPHAH